MMWNNRFQASGVRLAVGQLVELTGRFTLYAPKGRMNFDVFSIALAGGHLRMQVANLARKLKAEAWRRPANGRCLRIRRSSDWSPRRGARPFTTCCAHCAAGSRWLACSSRAWRSRA